LLVNASWAYQSHEQASHSAQILEIKHTISLVEVGGRAIPLLVNASWLIRGMEQATHNAKVLKNKTHLAWGQWQSYIGQCLLS